MNRKVIIEVNELTKIFGNFEAVKGISFDVFRGEIFGFIGANGAGKTTAIKMITGLLQATSGDAVVAGFSSVHQPEQVKRRIGYMSQRFSLYEDLTVVENIRFFGGIYGLTNTEIRNREHELVTDLGMESMARQLVADIPVGWKQKLAFSTSIIHKPDVVFLDEPTGGVDPRTRRQFWEMIYREAGRGTTIFVTTHYMDEAEYCDRISIMVEGEIKALDSPGGLKTKHKVTSIDDVFIKLARGNYHENGLGEVQ